MVFIDKGVDTAWTLATSWNIFAMQIGFLFLEAGCIRYKNILGIILKSIYDTVVIAFVWWLLGYGLAYGNESAGGFLGNITHDLFN